jgi:hypothetical protein
MGEHLELLYSDRRGSLGALFNFKTDRFTFRKALKTLTFDGAMVNKDILAAILYRDESETLFVVEPLYRALLCHDAKNPSILLV